MNEQTPILPVGPAQVRAAGETLRRYQAGKARLEQRIVEDEQWYRLRHWDLLRRPEEAGAREEPSSAWLFNAILNKHADAMDNYPSLNVLPREPGDAESARVLSRVLPAVLENTDFEQTYSDAWWDKLKHGTSAYGVFWDSRADNGLGDIAVREVDLLKLFWEPGITDIEQSKNLFLVELADAGALEERWPALRHAPSGDPIDLKRYLYDEQVDTSDKRLVVDWYYKKRVGGRTVLHYAKFVGETLLYASENDPALALRGYYDHGRYPVVLDVMFPEQGTPVGFGYVAVCREPQRYIDRLYANILDYALKASRPRHFIAASTGVNEAEYADWSKPLVHVEGTLDDTRIRQIGLAPLSGVYTNILQMKIEEMKDTAANRDVNSGGVTGGVTAASAIAALQEAGNKVSRDMIAASYRCYVRIGKLCIELMRQFYDAPRTFRISGAGDFASFSGRDIGARVLGYDAAGAALVRMPVFDLALTAQRRSPFSRLEQNERAKELYALGFFRPERAGEALQALEMMEFEGAQELRARLREQLAAAAENAQM